MDSTWLKACLLIRDIEVSLQTDLENTPLSRLSAKQIYVLAALFNGKLHATEVAKQVGAPPTSFTPTLDKLEQMKLIARFPDPDDRRAIFLELTVKGDSFRKPILDAIRHAETKYSES
jgi:DNA-binding MarR family transcriptional regulator